MSSRSASALLEAALAVPFDPEEEDRRQLALAQAATWDAGPVPEQQLDIAPENVMVPQLGPDPLVQAADAAMVQPGAGSMPSGSESLRVGEEQGVEPPLPQADEDLPPVGGAPRRSASALLADIPDAAVDVENVRGPGINLPRAEGTLDAIGNAITRGLTMNRMGRAFEEEAPDADRVLDLQRQMREAPASAEFQAAMNDDLTPQESWQAFKAAPVKVMGELLAESFSAFLPQMFEKAPARVLVGAGLGGGTALAAGQAGPQVAVPEEVITVPAGVAIGARAGYAEAAGAASFTLEMAGGILEGLEQAGVAMDNPEALREALEDPERMQLAREFAMKKAVPVAAFDAASALIAGRLAGKRDLSRVQKILRGAGETLIQSFMGAGGEAAGQLAQKGEISSVRSVMAEGLAETATGGLDIAAGVAFDRGETGAMAPGSRRSASAVLEAELGQQRTAGPAVPTEQPAPEAPKRVVVEQDDVFGEPTTTAAPEAAAPAPMGDERFAPSVMEQPVAAAAAEPAMATAAADTAPIELNEPTPFAFNETQLPTGNVRFIAYHGSEQGLTQIEDRPMYVSSMSDGAGYGNATRVVVEGRFLPVDQVEAFAARNGIAMEDLFHDEASMEPEFQDALRAEGYDGAIYYDQRRDDGDVIPAALVVNPQAVRIDEATPVSKARQRIKKMTSQSGAIDVSILEDIVQYGRTIYRAGMDYARWSGRMVREFGDKVAQFLRQAFDRIVAAYQASRFADTTGAVGNARGTTLGRRRGQTQQPGQSNIEITVAPLRRDSLTELSKKEVGKRAKSAKFIHLQQVADDISGAYGVPIVARQPIVGTWTERGQVSLEVPEKMQPATNDLDLAEEMAALIAISAPELQNGAMVWRDDPKGPDTMLSFRVRSAEAAQQIVQQINAAGLKGSSYDVDTRTFSIALVGSSEKTINKLKQYVEHHNRQGRVAPGQGTGSLYSTRSGTGRFPSEADYRRHIENARRRADGLGPERGAALRDVVDRAERRLERQVAAAKIARRAKRALQRLKRPQTSAAQIEAELKGRLFDNIRQLGLYLDERFRRLFNRASFTLNSQEGIDSASEALVYDILDGLSTDGSGMGWYDERVQETIRELAKSHPEFADDPVALSVYIAILATTSQGYTVVENFKQADRVYAHYKETGRMPTDFEFAKGNDPINSNLAQIQELIDTYGRSGFAQFMDEEITGLALRDQYGMQPTGVTLKDVVRGNRVLGPKIGSFFNNLRGRFDTITMDLWYTRTMHRYLGETVVPLNSEKMQNAIAKFRRELTAKGARTYGIDIAAALKSDEATVQAALTLFQRWARGKNQYSENGYMKFADGYAVEKAARTIFASGGMKGAPQNKSHRNYFADIVLAAQAKLKALGFDLNVADMQAIIWYREKNLFGRTGVANAAAKPADYLDAVMVARRRGDVEEDVATEDMADDQAEPAEAPAARAKLNIQRKLRPDSGAIDVSILEDIVEYGKTVYRAGMDLATWSAVMVKEFGQGVAQFLRQAFDRIVAAYQASRFSDTTGAVGDVRPRRTKPRQLEEKAMRNEALAAETRARLGSEYLPISLNAQAEAAKEWINTNGLDAAKLRIAQLSGEDAVPTPLDFAIGIEAAGRLSAAGDHQGAADIVSTMSHRATGMGQTISTLAMMARLSPEGIVFYGENLIRRYINALPPEAQDRIRALQAEVARLKAELAQAKFDQGSEVIRSGKLGDEKIQDRIKRRQRAKVEADLGPGASGPEVTAETRSRVISMNRAVRDVLLGDSTKAEATKAIEAILLEQGNLSASEAAAMAKSIADAFFKLMRETRTRLTNEAKGRGGRAGGFDRLLAMLREGKELSDADFLGELSRLLGLPGMTPAMARELRAIGQRYERATDPDVRLVLAGQMYEKAHELVPADFWVKVRGFAYLSMLFAPKTWIRNVVGNQIQWIANVGRDAFVTGILDPALSLFTGQRTSAGLKLGPRLKGLLAPIADVRRGYLWNKQENPSANFRQNVAAGVNHLRLLSKLTTQNKYEISDVRNVAGRIFSSRFMRMWEGGLSIALGAGDRAFWMSQFRASLAQMQAAAEKNGEWSGQPTPEMIEAAMAEAAYAIYQNPNILSQQANRVRTALNKVTTFGRTDQYGLGTVLMAFTQVPGSLTLRGLIEWSPLGFIPTLYRGMRGLLYASSDGRRGAKFDQAAFNKEFTQALIGTGAFYAAGYYLYAMGIITASREDDEDLEAMRRASGLGAYRINLTALRRALVSGNWFTRQEPQDGDLIASYDWAQPVAFTVAAGAEFAAQVERANRQQLKKNLADRAGMAAISMVAGAKSLEELPLLSGLMSFMGAIGQRPPPGESRVMNAMVKTITGAPSMFVPQLVRQATQLSDNAIRTTRAGDAAQREFDRIVGSLPGMSTKFPRRFDVTGQAIERYQYDGNTVANVLLNPALTSRYKADPVLQELGRLLNATGDAGMVPRQVMRKAKINGQDVELTNNQIAAYQYYVGNLTMSHFRWRMAAPVYARLPDEVKAKMLADDLTDIHSAVKSAVLGHDPRRLTRKQRFLRQALVNSPLGRSVPPR